MVTAQMEIAWWERGGLVWRRNSYSCLLTYRSYVLENQNELSGQAIASDMVRIGDYELLEKKNEGFETN